jgi:hypothetical protein
VAKRTVNKAEKIREAFEQLGHDARPKDVIAVLAAKRIKVAPAQVSNLKAKLGSPKRKGKKATAGLSLDSLLAAKKLVDTLGIERAKEAIDALAKLVA